MSLDASGLHRRYLKCLPFSRSDALKDLTEIEGLLALFKKGQQWISAPKPRKEADSKSYLKSL